MHERAPSAPPGEGSLPADGAGDLVDPGLVSGPPDQRRDALALLQQGTEAILDSDGFAAYLRLLANLNHYSVANTLLVLAQRPEATLVNSYRRWQTLGRQVRKGEHGLKIFVPHRRVIEVEQEDGTTARVVQVTGFGIGHVWDMAQTDGPPLPEPPPAVADPSSSDAAREVNRRLSRVLIDQGLTLERKTFPGAAAGYWRPGRNAIVLRRRDDGDPLSTQQTKTLVHEAAHWLADHRGELPRADAETVAESAAFVVLHRFGLDTGAYSFAYVARWAQDKAVLRRNLGAIRQVASGLIAAIAGVDDPDADGFGAPPRASSPAAVDDEAGGEPEGERFWEQLPERRTLVDEPYRFRGTWDREPEGVCRLRILAQDGGPPVLILSELAENRSTSVTNLIEVLVAEVLAKYLPQRFEHEEPAIVVEHDPPLRDPVRKTQGTPTYDRVTFGSWAPRRVWLGGQARLSLGEPDWRHLAPADVRDLLGEEADDLSPRPAG